MIIIIIIQSNENKTEKYFNPIGCAINDKPMTELWQFVICLDDFALNWIKKWQVFENILKTKMSGKFGITESIEENSYKVLS